MCQADSRGCRDHTCDHCPRCASTGICCLFDGAPQPARQVPARALLEKRQQSEQCAPCGEAGDRGYLDVRWNGESHVLSCPRHGDNPRTRMVDKVYEMARKAGLDVQYGSGLTMEEAENAPLRRWPRRRTEAEIKKDLEGLFG